MIQFILDNNIVLIWLAMVLFFVFFVGIFYQDSHYKNPAPSAVTCIASLIIFILLVFYTSSNYPVSGGPWKQIYQNNVNTTIELTYTDQGEKKTIATGKSLVEPGMLQEAAGSHSFLRIELRAKSEDNTLFKRVSLTQDNIKAKNVDPSNAKITKIEYRPIKGVAPKLFGKQGKPRASEPNLDGEIRITFESSKDKKLEKLFND